MIKYNFSGKKILILGASSTIGADNAVKLDESGATLYLAGRNKKKINQLINNLKSQDHKMIINQMESKNDLLEFTDLIDSKLDGVIFAIGTSKLIPLKLLKEKSFDFLFDTNIKLPVLLTKQLLNKKLLNKKSSLVYYTSVSYQKQFIGNPIYSSSKIALSNFVKSIAIELVPDSIRCNSIAPGFVLTDSNKSIHPELLKMMEKHYPNGFTQKEDVTSTCLFLLSDNSKGITGQEIIVDGGFTISL